MPSRDSATDTNGPQEALSQGERPLAAGAAVIASYLPRLPHQPGVYRMIASDGTVLYVGKAVDLKKRVASYAKAQGHTMRIARMIASTSMMEFVTTASAAEALLLEANLIKRLKPRFNVSLRDDKSFPHILVTGHHPAPQLRKHRGAQSLKGTYFGPFASAGAVNRTLNTLQRAFLLRSCSDSVYESRTRPCLLYQIKRCAAPCTGKIALHDYQGLVNQASAFLTGRSDAVRAELSQQMDVAAAALDFEKAARLRDRIRALAHVQLNQGINPETVDEADLFAIAQDGGLTCIQVFFFRSGQNWGNRAYFPRADKSWETSDILDSFLAQFYDGRTPPKLILLNEDIPGRGLLAEALSTREGRKIEVLVPQRGEKRALAEHAASNAREALARRLVEDTHQAALLAALTDVLGLKDTPERIEVYDNSHIQGKHALGAMVVAGPQGFEKGHYRKFNIKSAELTPGDDYGMMREVLTRRFKRLLKEREELDRPAAEALDGDADPPVFEDTGEEPAADTLPNEPDLVLIDGGPGQLSAAIQVMDALGLQQIPLLAIAKGPDRNAGLEHFYMRDRQPFTLDPKSPVMFFLQRLRDEAHRYAIGSHRQKRAAKLTASPLDEIEGIGPSRKRALLHHFGSARAVSQAGLPDLEAVEGVNKAMARKIYDFFHEKN